MTEMSQPKNNRLGVLKKHPIELTCRCCKTFEEDENRKG